ncbi:MAG: hypothetical protein V4736_10740 [Bdellovibrionota bacterium]
MKKMKIALPTAILVLSLNAAADNIRQINPSTIARLESESGLEIERTLVLSSLLARDEKGAYIYSEAELQNVISHLDQQGETQSSDVLKILAKESIIVRKVSPKDMVSSTQDYTTSRTTSK